MIQKKTEMSGVIIKALLGISITFIVAIPRLFQKKLFLSFMCEGKPLADLILITFATILIGITWKVLYNLLAKNNGRLLNLFIFILANILLGMFFTNLLILIISWLFHYFNVYIKFISEFTGVISFIAVLIGIIILPVVNIENHKINLKKNFFLIILIFLISFLVTILFLFLFHVLGLKSLIIEFVTIFIYSSALLLAELLILENVINNKMIIGKEPKYTEYFVAMSLVNGIIILFTESFKLLFRELIILNKK